jgi:hypothetical protein
MNEPEGKKTTIRRYLVSHGILADKAALSTLAFCKNICLKQPASTFHAHKY